MSFAFWLLVMSFILTLSALLLSLISDILGIYISSDGHMQFCPPTDKDELRKLLGSAYNARYMSIDRPRDFLMFTPEFAELDQLGDNNGWELADETDKKTGPRDFDRPPSDDFAVQPDFSRLLVKKPLPKRPTTKKRGGKLGRKTSDKTTNRNQSDQSRLVIDKIEAELNQLLNDSDSSELIRVRRSSSTTQLKSRPLLPWHCEMVIDWIDLGQNYFPRYLRSAKCTANRCFYHHYNCRPKAFTVKVLRRITDKCIEITEATKENFEFPYDIVDSDEPQFREPWVFEEKAVNFCCECAP